MTKPPRRKPAKAGAKKASSAVRPMRQAASSEAFPASRERSALATSSPAPDDAQVAALVRDLEQVIEAARQQVAVAANAALTTLYWQLGNRVHSEVLESRRAEYGARIVSALRRQLTWSHFKQLIYIRTT